VSKKKVKVIREIENGKKRESEGCWEFDLVNSSIQTSWKNRTEVLVHLNRTDGEESDFESLYEATIIRRCLSGSNNREVTAC
jgi:hypothetical protein